MIFRDSYGIPHLRARSVDELSFLQGRAAAYDRAWQLTYGRWRGEGRTAEFLGPSGVEWDRLARRARLADSARCSYDRLDAATQGWLTAYAAGVSSGLAAGARRSLELTSLGVPVEPWLPWTPIAVFAAKQALFGTIGYKLWRAHVRKTMGSAATAVFNLEGNTGTGSNAWVVGGSRTASGAPIIAGDPHRNLEQPGVYSQVRLACVDFDVAGLAFPGVPGVAHFGHAGSVAWGVTNAMADYQDLYVEDLWRNGRRVLVREAGGWAAANAHSETVAVRDRHSVEVDVVETARGPIIADLPDGTAYSLRTPSRVDCDFGFAAMLTLLHARTVADVEAALAGWVEPVNSYLVADTSGTMSHLVAGRVPIRDAQNQVGPVPGPDPRYAWSGYAPMFREPVDELAVNANDRASGGGRGWDYAPPDRATRIRGLLGERGGLDVSHMAAIHVDTYHSGALSMRRLLAGSVVEGPAAAARDALLAWDGRASAHSVGMTRFAQWRRSLVRWMLTQPQLAPLLEPTGYPSVFSEVTSPVVRVGAAWQRLVAADNPLGWDIAAGVAHALAEVAATPISPPWGHVHRMASLHPLSDVPGHKPILAETGMAGDLGCVLATNSTPGLTDRFTFGPTARYVWDLADRQASRWVVPLGASGCSDSPHQFDQLPLYASGDLVRLVTEWESLGLPPGQDL